MKLPFKLSAVCFVVISSAVIMNTSFAKDSSSAYWDGFDDGYDVACDDCYDDGYDDAMDDCHGPRLLAGFYAGIGGGYENYNIQRNVAVLDIPVNDLRSSLNGWYGNVYGGYGRYVHNRLYLGAEAFIGGSSAEGRDKVDVPGGFDYSGKVTAGGSYGVVVMPGVQVSSALLFLKAGFTQTKLTINDNSGGLGNSESKWVSGYIVGLGTELPVYRNFGLRFEYAYLNYGTVKNPGAVSSSNEISDNRGTVGLTYHIK